MIITQHEDLIEQRICNIINNVGLYCVAKNLINNLSPVTQSDHTSIVDACDAWVRLLTEECLQQHKAKVQKRFDKAITLNHLLAYCLQPTDKGQVLTRQQVQVALELLIAKDPDLMAHLCRFQAEAEPFLKSLFHDSCVGKLKPGVWWTCVKKACKGVNPGLCDLAIMLLHLPSSSASTERIFSNFGAIQTKLRNRLGLEKAIQACLVLS